MNEEHHSAAIYSSSQHFKKNILVLDKGHLNGDKFGKSEDLTNQVTYLISEFRTSRAYTYDSGNEKGILFRAY